MVIGFDAKRAFCNATGLGNYSRMIIGGLAELHPELKLCLYTPYHKDSFRSQFSDCPQVSVVEPGIHLGSNALWRSYGVSRTIRRDGLDLFHGLSHELPHGLPAGLPAVVTMHDLAVWRYPQHFPAVDRAIYKNKQRHACTRADHIIAVSGQTQRDLIDMLGVPKEKISVVHQSCHPQFTAPVEEKTRQRVRLKYGLPGRFVLCVGTVEERKNQRTVVKAFKALDEDLHLVIVGKQQRYALTVEEEIARQGLSSRVKMLEGVDFSDLPALYAEAVCSVYLSLFEGFGIPVLESMCCGTPVVCSNTSSLPEVGGEAALLVDPMDADDLAEAIRQLASDAAFRQQKSIMSLNQAASFSKEKVIGDLMHVYSQWIKS